MIAIDSHFTSGFKTFKYRLQSGANKTKLVKCLNDDGVIFELIIKPID